MSTRQTGTGSGPGGRAGRKGARPAALLDIAPGLALPLQAVTDTFAVLAKRRAGKSNAAVVMAEEMYDHGLPWVAIDPKGDWWGVRSSGDGDAPGLAVTVFGGRHGDLPLEPSAGTLLADLVVEERMTCVLDVSEMDDPDRLRFLLDFARRLYSRNTEPLHVFCEEADDYLPQGASKDELPVVRAFTRLVKQGGQRGIGVTLITQRSAMLHKNALSQTECMIALRTTAPTDRKVIAEWVSGTVDRAEVASDLPALGNGEAWIIAPHLVGEPTKIQFRRRRTFDSGATPVVGAAPVTPRRLADVDLDRIKAGMTQTIERAEADDPGLLRRRITALESDLRSAQAARRSQASPEPVERVVEQVVEVPVLSPEDVAALTAAADDVQEYARNCLHRIEVAAEQMRTLVDEVSARLREPVEILRAPRPATGAPGSAGRTPTPVRPTPARSAAPAKSAHAAPAAAPVAGGGAGLGKAERLILTVLAQHGALDVAQVALATSYSAKGGGFRNALSALRTAGRITGSGTIEITEVGRADLGPVEALPTGAALLQWWKQHPKIGRAEALILDVLAADYPRAVPTDEIAERTDYSPAGGGFRNALSRLRTLGLASGRGELVLADSLA
ncbi:DUF853 family protein [Nocardioides sp. Leaf285]|uniref:DUF853 family protein n=1 Tax=Nocardioides sp. Leaf285 TaxID=1736322 RepID=UPI000703B444|nr:DUF853 family protein [Nocardioides sp. Leaf285]KQP62954.1 hypothetical protein ASF47_18245 [Nocardioides sp. Leaf285]